jgi:hypothetical protein
MKTEYLRFLLSGQSALWRNPEDGVGSISCLGPAPSQLSGIIGAVFGFSSTNRRFKARGDWPVAPELLAWGRENRPRIACRLLNFPQRFELNFIGPKQLGSFETGRFEQTLLASPLYEVAISLAEIDRLETALRAPVFRIGLGSQSCPGFIRRVGRTGDYAANWAQWTEEAAGDTTPFTRHLLNSEIRIQRDGYWNYLPPKESLLSCALREMYLE